MQTITKTILALMIAVVASGAGFALVCWMAASLVLGEDEDEEEAEFTLGYQDGARYARMLASGESPDGE